MNAYLKNFRCRNIAKGQQNPILSCPSELDLSKLQLIEQGFPFEILVYRLNHTKCAESFALSSFFRYFTNSQEKYLVMNENNIEHPVESLTLPAGRDLKAAIQKARIEDAERSDLAADLRAAEFSRLEMLFKHLVPVFSQLPKEADMFNHGLVPGERPRIYIDMVAFIEMSRDRRTYRLLLDTLSGRQLLGESDDTAIMAEAITNYIGRRIVERDKALASHLKFETVLGNRSIEHSTSTDEQLARSAPDQKRQKRGNLATTFILGLLIGAVVMLLYFMLQSRGDLPWPSPLDLLEKL